MNSLLSCAVCFGEPDSLMTKGAEAGVWLLLGVIVFVLFSIVTVLFTWSRRAKLIAASEAYEARPAVLHATDPS